MASLLCTIFILPLEVSSSNRGSSGRVLRCVKYATKYLKAHGNSYLCREYSFLKLKNDRKRIIPAYSEEEITKIVEAANTNNAIGKRDLAIILIAYCTGLREIDIIRIKLSDIDWHNQKISIIQSKTHTPIICEINGSTLNALADMVGHKSIVEDKPYITYDKSQISFGLTVIRN